MLRNDGAKDAQSSPKDNPSARLAAVAEALDRSPLFHLSLSSRELFHSNFLGWLFRVHPEACGFFVPEDWDLREAAIHRERLNLDLCIEGRAHVLVIENKVKSIPDVAQLERYDDSIARSFAGKSCRKILLSLMPPGAWIKETGWESFGYDRLGQCLEAWCDGARIDPEHRPIVLDYARMVGNLHTLLHLATEPEGLPLGTWFTAKETADHLSIQGELTRLRMGDTLAKYQAASLIATIEATMANAIDSIEKEGLWLDFEHGLTNKTPVVSVGVNRETSAGKLRMGVQIQGRQYRRFIQFPGIAGEKTGRLELSDRDLLERARRVDGFRWLLADKIPPERLLSLSLPGGLEGDFATGMRRAVPIKKYAPHFIYQYVTVGEGEHEVAPDRLLRIVHDDILFVARLVADNGYVERLLESMAPG